jgi:hypothetical protein
MKSAVVIAAAAILFTVPAVAHDTSDVVPRQKTYRSEHLGASTLPPGQKTHWYKGQPGASYWAPGHQKRVYGVRSGPREITTETTTRGASTSVPFHKKRLYGATSGPREITTETTTRHKTMDSTRQRNSRPSNNGL